MSYTLDPSDHFRRRFAKFIKKHPELKTKIAEIFVKLESNPFDQSLKLHKLQGKLSEFHAVSITYQYRIVLVLLIDDQNIVLADIGSHDEVYG